MRLNGFQLEILVNDEPLEEYNLPMNDSSSTTGPSFVFDEMTGQRTNDENATYVAVVPEAKYSIRFSSTRASIWAPLMANVYVDGEFDHTYSEISSSSTRKIDCFWNNTFSKKYFFKFEVSRLIDIDNLEIPLQRKSYGGLGAISVYFYKAKAIPQREVYLPNFSGNQAQVSESKSTCGIKFTTAFEESDEFTSRQAVTTMEKQSKDPVSVLHIHYRPATWLSIRGCNINSRIEQPNHPSPIASEFLDEIKPYSFQIKGEETPSSPVRKTKYKIIRAPVTHSDNIIEVENKISSEIIDLENYTPKTINKRTYTKVVDVIELLDSEEEEEGNPSKVIRIG